MIMKPKTQGIELSDLLKENYLLADWVLPSIRAKMQRPERLHETEEGYLVNVGKKVLYLFNPRQVLADIWDTIIGEGKNLLAFVEYGEEHDTITALGGFSNPPGNTSKNRIHEAHSIRSHDGLVHILCRHPGNIDKASNMPLYNFSMITANPAKASIEQVHYKNIEYLDHPPVISRTDDSKGGKLILQVPPYEARPDTPSLRYRYDPEKRLFRREFTDAYGISKFYKNMPKKSGWQKAEDPYSSGEMLIKPLDQED